MYTGYNKEVLGVVLLMSPRTDISLKYDKLTNCRTIYHTLYT